MGDHLFNLRGGPGALWAGQRPEHCGHVQGDGDHRHPRALTHPLQPGQVRPPDVSSCHGQIGRQMFVEVLVR